VRLSRDELMDLLGDVSLRLLSDDRRRLRLYRPDRGATLATWVGVIAVSTTRDYLRRARRHPVDRLEEEALEQLISEAPGPEDELLDHERREAVEQLLSRLTERERHFVRLYFGNKMTPAEVAEEMGISIATVYSKKNKLRARLSALLDKTAGSEDEVAG
jgi:RNA polymerase sigma-70 factor, ECF subfamily